MTVTELQQRVRAHRRPRSVEAPRPVAPVVAPVVAPEPTDPSAPEPSAADVELREVVAIPFAPALRLAVRVGIVSYAMWLAALMLFAAFGALVGLTGHVEDSVRSLGFRGFQLVSLPVLGLLVAFGAIWITSAVLLALLGVTSFNVASGRSHRLRLALAPRRPGQG